MSYQARGFTGIEILVVIVIIGLLAGGGAVAYHAAHKPQPTPAHKTVQVTHAATVSAATTPIPTPTPTPTPTPEPTPVPTPVPTAKPIVHTPTPAPTAVPAYQRPLDSFADLDNSCQYHTVAYVVNPNGAPMYKNNDLISPENVRATIPSDATINVYCQKGDLVFISYKDYPTGFMMLSDVRKSL